jgi:hypothetical protein
MFRTTLKARRATLTHARQSWFRPGVESLEDRVVPSLIPNGWLVVPTFPSTIANNPSGVSGLVAVNPTNGSQQIAISTGGLFSEPTSVAEDPATGLLYVTDYNAINGKGAVIQVDPNQPNGSNQTLIAGPGAFINGPNALVVLNGFAYVADIGTGLGDVANIVKIGLSPPYPQTLVTNMGGFETATGMVLDGGNNVYVSDEQGNFDSPFHGALWEVNLGTGVQTLIDSGPPFFDHPVGLALGSNGNLLIANTGNPNDNVRGTLFQINPVTRQPSWIVGPPTSATTSFGDFSGTNAVGVGSSGQIFVTNIADGAQPARIFEVTGTNSFFTFLSDGSLLSAPGGLITYQNVTPVQTPTVTSLASSQNPSTVGQPVTFTATVSPTSGSSTPTGTVQFKIDNSVVSTMSLSGGTASFTTSFPTATSHSVVAVYTGNSSFFGSTSNTVSQQVNPPAATGTTTNVTSSANPSVFGQSVFFTATVFPTSGNVTPTGSVQFQINGQNFGPAVPLSNGTANSQSISTLGVNTSGWTVQAIYTPNTSSFSGSSGMTTQVVNPASTTTALTSSANPSQSGQPVTFTATVSPVSPGAGTPTGTVTFSDGSTTLGTGSLSNGTATFSTSSLSVGTHNITATYGGDGNFTGSTSNTVAQSVTSKPATTTTTTIASSVNPSVFGQPVTFTATVSGSGGTPTGTVTFFDGGSNIGTGTLSGGTTSITVSSLSVGTHNITASYGGNSTFASSTSSILQQTVSQASTTTALTSSANPSQSGQNVTFTATVSPVSPGAGTPSGTVTFSDGSTTLGTGSLSNGTATFSTSSLGIGTHNITATYGGDGNFTGSTSNTVAQSVTNTPATTTTTTIAASVNPSVFGQPVTFTATVSGSGGTPTGTVTFFDGGSNIGTGTLSGGTTSITVSSLSVGTHNITASYGGNSTFASSTSSILQQTVSQASTTTALTSSANPSQSGQNVTFTATVSPVGPGAGTPSGTVTFSEGSTTLGTGSLSNGTATFSTSSLGVGTHNITAAYGGDTNFTGSTSNTVAQSVTNKPATSTTTTIASSVNPSVSGQPVTFTATVSGSGGTPSGTVTFFDGSNSLGSQTLSGGTASITVSSLSVGAHSITASYGGDSTFAASTSSVLQQTVNPVSTITPTTVAVTSSANPSTVGQSISFTATVTPTSGSGTPTGLVAFFVDGTQLGNHVPLSNGVATSPAISSLSAGSHTITVNYTGDSNFAPSSGTFTQVVNQATSVGVQDGTILVASSHSGGPTGVIGIDPSTLTQFLVSTGGNFVMPMHITEDTSGHNLYVSDFKATGKGAVIDVDPSTGNQSVVASGGSINGPNAILFMNGHIYVADDGTPNIVEITPANGKQNVITTGGNLKMPVGLAPAPGNNIYVLDETAFGTGAIFEVDLHSGAQTVISKGNLFTHPVDMSVDPHGRLVVINEGLTAGPASIIFVDPASGTQTLLAVRGTLVPGVTSGFDDVNGTIYVGAMTMGASPGQILTVVAQTGAQSTLTSDVNLDVVKGVFVYHTPGGGAAAVPPGGGAAGVVGPAQLSASSLTPAATAVSSTGVPLSIAQLSGQAADGTQQAAGTDQAGDSTAAIDAVFANWATGSQEAPLGALQGVA